MARYRFIIFALTMIAAFGCARVKVSQDYKTGIDFAGIETFAWAADTQAKTGDLRVDNPLMDERIRAAVAQRLGETGFRPVPAEATDVLVAYQYQIRQKIRSSDTRTGVGFGIGSGGGMGGVMIGTGADVRTDDEGFLVIDFLRPPEGALLWRGNATFVVPEHQSPEQSTELIAEAVAKILEQFPPKHE